jgi:hypothetical protein
MSQPPLDTEPTPNAAIPADDAQASASAAAEPSRWALWGGGLLALLLLGAAIWFVYGAQGGAANAVGPLANADPALTYVADLDFWQRTPRESTVLATAYFDLDHALADVPLQVGSWSGEVRAEENQEVLILLEPEQYEQRLYRDADGFPMWLSLVGGRSSQPFHAPDICYDADGWQYSLGSVPFALEDGGQLWGLYLTAHKEKPAADGSDSSDPTLVEHVVSYFYLFPDAGRTLDEGIVLFKLTSSLVGSEEETLARHADFVRNFFVQAAATSPNANGPAPALAGQGAQVSAEPVALSRP